MLMLLKTPWVHSDSLSLCWWVLSIHVSQLGVDQTFPWWGSPLSLIPLSPTVSREAVPVLPNTVPEWPRDAKSHLGRRSEMGQGFKKPDRKTSMLSFNPTFILELYIIGTQELVAMSFSLYLSCLSGFVPLFFSLLTEYSIRLVTIYVQWAVYAVIYSIYSFGNVP